MNWRLLVCLLVAAVGAYVGACVVSLPLVAHLVRRVELGESV